MPIRKLRCFVISNPSPVSPDPDVEPVAKPVSPIAADFRKPARAAVQLGGSAAFRHQEDALPGHCMRTAERFDFLQIRRLGNDELEPRLRRTGEKPQGFRIDPQ